MYNTTLSDTFQEKTALFKEIKELFSKKRKNRLKSKNIASFTH